MMTAVPTLIATNGTGPNVGVPAARLMTEGFEVDHDARVVTSSYAPSELSM
jgi:hypothetical protein